MYAAFSFNHLFFLQYSPVCSETHLVGSQLSQVNPSLQLALVAIYFRCSKPARIFLTSPDDPVL